MAIAKLYHQTTKFSSYMVNRNSRYHTDLQLYIRDSYSSLHWLWVLSPNRRVRGRSIVNSERLTLYNRVKEKATHSSLPVGLNTCRWIGISVIHQCSFQDFFEVINGYSQIFKLGNSVTLQATDTCLTIMDI